MGLSLTVYAIQVIAVVCDEVTLAAWRCGYDVGSVNGVKQQRARLVLG